VSAEPVAVPFWSPEEVEAALAPTIAYLQSGGVLAYPTETVYGFGGAVDYDSVERLVALKRRPSAKPFLLLISGSEMISRLGLHLTSSAARIAARHWPGPVTLVLRGGERRVPARLRGPEGGVAVRWTPPDHVHEREPAGGTAGDVGNRDFAAVARCDHARHDSRARRGTPLALESIHRHRLHGAAAASDSPWRDSREDAARERA
jgi:hypothetical protein